jgi:uncharacterized protein (UPF0333 family)
MKKGQSSAEYIFVVSLALILIVPATFLFMNYSTKSTDTIASSEINRMGNQILNKVKEMYVVGENSWATLEMNLPENVHSIEIIDNEELVINYTMSSGYSEAVFFTDINITNETPLVISPGYNNFRIESKGTYVVITTVV